MEVVEKRCGNEEGLVRSLRDGGLKKRERVGLGRKKRRETWVKGSDFAIGVEAFVECFGSVFLCGHHGHHPLQDFTDRKSVV